MTTDDFFGDDFTAELKGYYLDSLQKEIAKFIDLIDESTWKKVRVEIREQSQSWSVDAKSNEFEFLSAWFLDLQAKLDLYSSHQDLIHALQTAKKYVENLVETKKDSADYPSQYALTAEAQGETLYLHCKVTDQEFVIPIKNVVEVIGSLPLFPLPEKRRGFLGVIPFRGDAVPVFNLQDHGFQNVSSNRLFYVICEFEGLRFSLQVTETDELINLHDKDLQSVENNSVMNSVSFIRNSFVKDQRSMLVLDIERLVAA